MTKNYTRNALREGVRDRHVQALFGITDSIVISFHLAFCRNRSGRAAQPRPACAQSRRNGIQQIQGISPLKTCMNIKVLTKRVGLRAGSRTLRSPTDSLLRPKMRVLYTTPVLEHPPANGPALRVENSIKALARGGVVLVPRVNKAKVEGQAGAFTRRCVAGSAILERLQPTQCTRLNG